MTLKEKVMEIIAEKNMFESAKANLIIDIIEFYCIKRESHLLTCDLSGLEYKEPLDIVNPAKGWNP